ncbi:hypothetical protein EK21DRAFT_86055 [Setomelanomma holmii]|uniref:Uncharacterized protein n=1 Tax=Setomelanomma holmii TaxID=210430 RepID=A0A9P4HIM5_9PLEO|nr:hypothetical protein EK21DRAFT_86055 [Setomelanomma holmii]
MPTTFFDLPAELRDEVYAYLWSDVDFFYVRHNGNITLLGDSPYDGQSFIRLRGPYTSGKMLPEATAVFQRVGSFRLLIRRNTWYAAEFFESGFFAPFSHHHIRELTIDHRIPRSLQSPASPSGPSKRPFYKVPVTSFDYIHHFMREIFSHSNLKVFRIHTFAQDTKYNTNTEVQSLHVAIQVIISYLQRFELNFFGQLPVARRLAPGETDLIRDSMVAAMEARIDSHVAKMRSKDMGGIVELSGGNMKKARWLSITQVRRRNLVVCGYGVLDDIEQSQVTPTPPQRPYTETLHVTTMHFSCLRREFTPFLQGCPVSHNACGEGWVPTALLASDFLKQEMLGLALLGTMADKVSEFARYIEKSCRHGDARSSHDSFAIQVELLLLQRFVLQIACDWSVLYIRLRFPRSGSRDELGEEHRHLTHNTPGDFFSLLINNYSSTTTHQQLLINNYSSTTTHQQLLINNYSSTTTHQQPKPRCRSHRSSTSRVNSATSNDALGLSVHTGRSFTSSDCAPLWLCSSKKIRQEGLEHHLHAGSIRLEISNTGWVSNDAFNSQIFSPISPLDIRRLDINLVRSRYQPLNPVPAHQVYVTPTIFVAHLHGHLAAGGKLQVLSLSMRLKPRDFNRGDLKNIRAYGQALARSCRSCVNSHFPSIFIWQTFFASNIRGRFERKILREVEHWNISRISTLVERRRGNVKMAPSEEWSGLVGWQFVWLRAGPV